MALATRLDVNASIERQDLPMDIFNTAGEMFVYLNTCPQNYVKFYKYLFDKQSVTDIILTIQNAIKNFHKERFRQISETIFQRLAKILGFEYIKPDELLKWRKNINSVRGKVIIRQTAKGKACPTSTCRKF